MNVNEQRIKIRLDRVMVERGVRLGELANVIGITNANLSILKNGKAKAVKLATLAKLCDALNCQPGDILEYE